MKILLNKYFRWSLFALYLTVLLTLPLAILGSAWGLFLGLVLSLTCLGALYWRAEEKLFKKLNLVSLSLAESPELHHSVKELSRRIGIVPPKITTLKTDALNIGVFGLSQKRTVLILTEGLLANLSRAELCALIGRELTAVGFGDTCLSTWFSTLLNAIETVSFSQNASRTKHRKGIYPLNWVLSQMVFLPVALVPQYLLLGIRNKINLDTESLKLSRLPKELNEGYRLLQAMAARNTLKAPLSAAPLFLLGPTSAEPISKILLSKAHNRISLEKPWISYSHRTQNT